MGIVPNTPRGRDGPEEGPPPHLFINPLYRFHAVMVVTRPPLSVRGVVRDLHALAVARHAHLIPQNRAVLQGHIVLFDYKCSIWALSPASAFIAHRRPRPSLPSRTHQITQLSVFPALAGPLGQTPTNTSQRVAAARHNGMASVHTNTGILFLPLGGVNTPCYCARRTCSPTRSTKVR